MTVINPLTGKNQTTVSSRMKSLFLALCFALLIASSVLYKSTTINWNTVHTYLSNRWMSVPKPFELNITFTSTTTSKSPIINTNRRFALFACSIHSSVEAYTFYTPITASSWKRVGYETIVIFVGDFNMPNILSARLNLSRAYLKHVGAHIIDVQCNSSYAVKLSQIIRIFGGFLPDSIIHDDDDIITADSDLMPLRARDYKPTDGTGGFIFNAFCCGSFQRRGKSYRMFPMGHIYLKKKTWRAMIIESIQRSELLLANNTDDSTQALLSENASLSFDVISIYLRQEFKELYDSKMVKGDAGWYMDQILCSMLLTDYRDKHKDFTVSERGRGNRLDRANDINYWNRRSFHQFGDAHLIHDSILQEHNWKIFNKLLEFLFNKTLVNLFNDYHRQYMITDKTF
ncbi:hypothetical protein I4U23_001753 [Adineta vaga]|nr:hypothetical protein I4U23_001753 [Adineta vaga]